MAKPTIILLELSLKEPQVAKEGGFYYKMGVGRAGPDFQKVKPLG